MAWKKNGSNWNYINSDGSKKTGWVKDKGKWYFLDKSGNMMTGWVQTGGKWYYMNGDGSMRTGWVKDKGKWYSLGSDGAMQTGPQMIDGTLYEFGSDGAMTYEDKPFEEDTQLLNDWKAAQSEYDEWSENHEAHGLNQHITEVNDLFNQVMNQEKFSYDPSKDALFQMYKKQYQAQGTRAMNNTMAMGAAMSGGYASSNSMTSAQNTYQQYMDGLNDKVAQTYQNALDMYKYNQQQLTDRFNTAVNMNNAGNDAYYSRLGVLGNRADNAYSVYSDDKTFRYGVNKDKRDAVTTRWKLAQDQKNADRIYGLNKTAYTG